MKGKTSVPGTYAALDTLQAVAPCVGSAMDRAGAVVGCG